MTRGVTTKFVVRWFGRPESLAVVGDRLRRCLLSLSDGAGRPPFVADAPSSRRGIEVRANSSEVMAAIERESERVRAGRSAETWVWYGFLENPSGEFRLVAERPPGYTERIASSFVLSLDGTEIPPFDAIARTLNGLFEAWEPDEVDVLVKDQVSPQAKILTYSSKKPSDSRADPFEGGWIVRGEIGPMH